MDTKDDFGVYVVVDGNLMCFASHDERDEWLAEHITNYKSIKAT